MNRIDRISAILIQLQSKKVVKGQEIADRFSISLRTAYRDIRTLEEAGVPIVSEAGIGYSIMEGYRLPPVIFTKEEATAFLTAEKLVEKFTDESTFKIYQSALFKIKAVLKGDEKDHLETMYDHIEVISNPYVPTDKKTGNFMQTILQSISSQQTLTLDYHAIGSQEKTTRVVEPVGIFLSFNHWYLIAFCRMRNAYRNFRIDRMKKVALNEQAFQKKHPSLKSYLNSIAKEQKDVHTIVLQLDKSILSYLGEQKYYHGFVSEREVKGKVEMTFLCGSIEGFARWFLMIGDRAEVISPPELKKRIKEIAKSILKNL